MYEENIDELNKWFDDPKRSYFTGYNDNGEYTVDQTDVDDFCNYLRENEPDLIGISCMVDTDGVWFKRKDLDKARYY